MVTREGPRELCYRRATASPPLEPEPYLATKISSPAAGVRVVSLGSPRRRPPCQEGPGHVAVAARGGRDADRSIGAAGLSGRQQRAVGPVLGHEDIVVARRGEGGLVGLALAKGRRARENTRSRNCRRARWSRCRPSPNRSRRPGWPTAARRRARTWPRRYRRARRGEGGLVGLALAEDAVPWKYPVT